MERDPNRWKSFSLDELLTLNRPVDLDWDMSRELGREIARRYAGQDKKAEARATSEHLAVAAEAVDVSRAGIASDKAVARRSETAALRRAVRAIIKHLEERP